MKTIFKNSNLVFQKYRVNKNIVFDGIMTSTNHNGVSKTIDLQPGNYLVSLPEQLWSLVNYTDSYIFYLKINDTILYNMIGSGWGVGTEYGSVNYSNLRCSYYITVNTGDIVEMFIRADSGTSVPIHIENVRGFDEVVPSVYYTESITFTQGSSMYGKTSPSSLERGYIYFLADNIKPYVKQIEVQPNKQPSSYITYLMSYDDVKTVIPEGTGSISLYRWNLAGGDAIGSGTADFTILRIPISAIKY